MKSWDGTDLTKDEQGFVYWKNIQVEHYSFDDIEKENEAAQKLIKKCIEVESKGWPICSRTLYMTPAFNDAPANTPWLNVLLSYYTFFRDKDGKASWIVVYGKKSKAIAVRSVGNSVLELRMSKTTPESLAYDLFNELQDAGYVATVQPGQSYANFIEFMDELNLKPEDLEILF